MITRKQRFVLTGSRGVLDRTSLKPAGMRGASAFLPAPGAPGGEIKAPSTKGHV